MKQLTKKEACAFFDNKCYEGWSNRDIAVFQLHQERLCMPFEVFGLSLESELKRGISAMEYVFGSDGLKKELMKDQPVPELEYFMGLIPKEKRELVFPK